MSVSTLSRSSSKKRLDILSLKKNKKKTSPRRLSDKAPPAIIIDESNDGYCKQFISSKRGDWTTVTSSPIVIDDSIEEQHPDDSIFKSPPAYKKTETPKKVTLDSRVTPKSGNVKVDLVSGRPSFEGWSPAQEIICVSPKFNTPSRDKDVANESLEECSIKKIEESHKNILDELYGNAWRSIPSLFKKKLNSVENFDPVPKKLDFLDDSDKENGVFDDVRKFYTEEDYVTPRTKTDAKIKKKLYTDVTNDTPEVRKIKKELLNFTEPKPKVNKEAVKVKKPQTEKKKTDKGPDNYEVFKAPDVKNKDLEIAKRVKELQNDLVITKKKTAKTAKKLFEDGNDLNVEKLSFMASLADNVPSWRSEHTALDYKKNYKTKRDKLTRRLFQEFNRFVFNDGLENDMPIVWDSKLRSTAGTTTNRLIKTSNLTKLRTSSIKLSTKVIDGPQRLRDTLIHEMCHSATWVIDNELRAGHGPLWKKWARRALKVFPELQEISRCHSLEIHFKYSYKCIQCGYTINRHSKSIDTSKKCCGYCRGKFELALNKRNKDGVVVSTPAKKATNDFARYVKENYAELKAGRPHGDVMRLLSERYAELKTSGALTFKNGRKSLVGGY